MKLLSRSFSKSSPELFDAPRPDQTIAVVGDIHGRADLLDKLLTRLDKRHPDALKIFVGDYIDRGPESQKVLHRLRSLPGAVCLRGNHEEMLIDFLSDPSRNARLWLHNGGRETIASFGIDLAADLPEVQEALLKRLSDGTVDWLRGLPLLWRSGNLLVCHAGPDPAEPVEKQPPNVFTWGHGRFLRDRRTDGLWVAHGHWVQERAQVFPGRIAVDTGACFTGRLTAALIRPVGRVAFLT